jgi:hypothetical protein
VFFQIFSPRAKKKSDTIVNTRNDKGMVFRLYAYDSITAQPIAQNNVIPILFFNLVNLFLDDGLHLLRGSMQCLLQENEGNPVGLKAEKLISHDVASNDKIFHICHLLLAISYLLAITPAFLL